MEDRSAGAPWLDDHGILRGVLPARPRTPEDVDRFVESARRILSGRTAPVILDARRVTAASPEAYQRAVTSVSSFASAVAFVVSDVTPERLRIYQAQIDSLLVPCRLFDDAVAAERWIASLGPDSTSMD